MRDGRRQPRSARYRSSSGRYSGTPAPVSIRIGSRRPTRDVLVPGPVIHPGLSPSTRPTRSLGVAVCGNLGSIHPMSLHFRAPASPAQPVLGEGSEGAVEAPSDSYAEGAVLDILAGRQLGRRPRPHDTPLLENVVPVGDAGELAHILVHEEDGLPARLQALDA